jgi:hypothetical protein
MVIVSCIFLEGKATLDRLRQNFRILCTVYERLRCRVVEQEWHESNDFNVNDHCCEITVRPPETLTSVLGDYVSTLLPEDRPLWSVTLVHDVFANRDLVVFRSHHALGDGLSLVQMMNWMFDLEAKEFEAPVDEEGGSRTYDREAYEKHKKKQEAASKLLIEDGGGSESFNTKTAESAASMLSHTAPSVKSRASTNSHDDFENEHSSMSKVSDTAHSALPAILNIPSGVSAYSGGSLRPNESSVNLTSEREGTQIREEATPSRPVGPAEKGIQHFDTEEPRHRLYSRTAVERKKHKPILHWPVLFVKIFYMVLWAPARLLNILLLRSDPQNCLKLEKGHEISIQKNVAMSTPIDLVRIKRLSKNVGGTVNDVIVACTAIALRNHMLARFHDDETKIPSHVRCILPMSLREPTPKSVTLDNRVSAVFLTLPLKETNPKRVLLGIKRQMDRLKLWPDAFIIYGLIYVLVNWCPQEWFERCLRWFYGKCTILLSNVPGRRRVGYIAGSKVADMCFWVPLVSDGCVGLSIYSDYDHVVFSCLSDPEVLDSPSDLCEEYAKAFNHLERMVVGKNYENTTDRAVELNATATLKVTREEERSRRKSKILEESIDVGKGVEAHKQAKKLRANAGA